ncbi:MAG: hypothetical protein ABI612_24945 [Betaproteobacteria bacterium]
MKRQLSMLGFLAAIGGITSGDADAIRVLNDANRAAAPQIDVGQIDAIDLGGRAIVISGRRYRFYATKAEIHKNGQTVDAARLMKGMAVQYTVARGQNREDLVTEIWVLPPPSR